MTERVLVFNGYGGSNSQGPTVARWVAAANAQVALVSELGKLADDLDNIGKVWRSVKDTPPDVAVVTRFKIPNKIEVSTKQLTKFIRRDDKPLLWRDRHVVRVVRRNRAYYSVHANAAISDDEGKWWNNEGAKEWRTQGLPTLIQMIMKDQDNGLSIRVGGDMNFFESDAPMGPKSIFDDLGLAYINSRAMWLAWSREDQVVAKQIMDKAPGADAHNALLVELRAKRKSKKKR